MTLETREVVVTVTVIATSDERAENVVDEALTEHGSVIVWRIISTSDASGEAPEAVPSP
jgi:hypothetical protein